MAPGARPATAAPARNPTVRGRSLTRVAAAMAQARASGREPEHPLAGDVGALAVLRAAIAPMTDPGGAALLQVATAAFLVDIAPASAAAALMLRAGATIPGRRAGFRQPAIVR